ncbi:unnamed protein product [Fraxinus pennsylvanica]|uniref:Uncharacterized protein n=1 Tax=Fraxinus pennsylvanica TaxID=56036 RepID=A0AAD1ZJA0_9LAMI|nr:unnamed protein product [Fraxinus pennsylvanica]
MDDIVDDLQSMSFNSTATDIHRSTSYALKPSIGPAHPPTTSTLPLPLSNLTPPLLNPVTHAGGSIHRFHCMSLSDLCFLHHLGSRNIRSIYLANLKSSSSKEQPKPSLTALFAAKVMDKKKLANKVITASPSSGTSHGRRNWARRRFQPVDREKGDKGRLARI